MKDKLVNNCASSKELADFLIRKGGKHQSLKSYGTENTLSPVVKDGILRLSDGESWNDRFDAEQFNSIKLDYKQFGKCFTFSKSQSVAMWFIYGKTISDDTGTKHAGIMIDFKKQIQKLLKSLDKIKLYYYNRESGKIEGSELFLSRNQYDIFLVDMLYVGDQLDGTITIKRSDERIESVDTEIVDDIVGFTKEYPWSYENECRLVVRVKTEILGGNRFNTVQVPIPNDIRRNLAKNVYLTPIRPDTLACAITCKPSVLTNNVRFE